MLLLLTSWLLPCVVGSAKSPQCECECLFPCWVLQEFFGQLDQRVLNSFLKACDELTDILPEPEQQSLQETVRKLHKHWKVGPMRDLDTP